MSEEQATKQPSVESSIPPPPDPFPTYQTPYPQSHSSSNDPNAFILFRQFADSQLSSIFAKLPPVLRSTFGLNAPPPTAQAGVYNHPCDDEIVKMIGDPSSDFNEILRKLEICSSQHDETFRKSVNQHLEESRMRELELGQEVKKLQHEIASRPLSDALDELSMYERLSRNGKDHKTRKQQMLETPTLVDVPFPGELNRPLRDPSEGLNPFDPQSDEQEALLWLISSPYSPLKLKQQRGHSSHGPSMANLLDWESAFHELVAEEESDDVSANALVKDKSTWKRNLLNSYETAKIIDRSPGPAYDVERDANKATQKWIADLDKAIANAWPTVWDGFGPKIREARVSDASHKASFDDRNSPSLNEERGRLADVLSQTTSITRNHRPDGSYETRKIRKVLYKDGREDTSETIKHHPNARWEIAASPEKNALQGQPVPTQASDEVGKTQQSPKPVGKGWFWN